MTEFFTHLMFNLLLRAKSAQFFIEQKSGVNFEVRRFYCTSVLRGRRQPTQHAGAIKPQKQIHRIDELVQLIRKHDKKINWWSCHRRRSLKEQLPSSFSRCLFPSPPSRVRLTTVSGSRRRADGGAGTNSGPVFTKRSSSNSMRRSSIAVEMLMVSRPHSSIWATPRLESTMVGRNAIQDPTAPVFTTRRVIPLSTR